jgi:ATP-dependent helicase HrpA
MDGLLPREFPRSPGAGRLADTHRYLRAIGRRLDKLAEHPRRDRELMTRVQEVQAEYDRVVRSMADVERRAEARRVRWMIEELRVSHFAQSLGAAYPVSEKRILKTLASL